MEELFSTRSMPTYYKQRTRSVDSLFYTEVCEVKIWGGGRGIAIVGAGYQETTSNTKDIRPCALVKCKLWK
jgi:hypothetical protein